MERKLGLVPIPMPIRRYQAMPIPMAIIMPQHYYFEVQNTKMDKIYDDKKIKTADARFFVIMRIKMLTNLPSDCLGTTCQDDVA